MSNADSVTHNLDVPGARLSYEVRGSGPVLLLIGAPMDSTGFVRLAPLLSDDYTVVTPDPRGISRSTCDDPTEDATPDLLADDVHRLLSTLGTEPAHVFGSSGGAVTGLALVTRHPGQVHTLVAHEPPLPELLPERAPLRAALDDVVRSDGPAAAWQKFHAVTGIAGGPYLAGDEPKNAARPETIPPEGRRANPDFVFAHMIRPITRYRPDIPALRAASTRIVVGGGTSSRGQLPQRSAAALATELETPLIDFPGSHWGFAEWPEAFGSVLRRVLSAKA